MRILLNHKTWRISHQENTKKSFFLICTLNKSITFAAKIIETLNYRTKRNQAYEFVYLYILFLLLLLLQQESRVGVCMYEITDNKY